MKRTAVLLVFLGALTSALGEDAKKSRLYADDPWRQGETTTEVGSFRQTLRPTVPVASNDARKRVLAIEYAVVRRCLAVDAAGRWQRGEAAVTRWRRTGGAAEDRSIEGALVALEAGGAWKIASGGGEPTDDAKQWLSKTFGQKDAMGGDGDGKPSGEAPNDEMAVGTPVAVRMTSFEQGYANLGIPVPADGIVAKYLLTAVEPTAEGARIECVQTIDASLEGVGRSGEKETKYLPGSEVHQRIVYKKTLGRAHASCSYRLENDFVLVFETPQGAMKSVTSVAETLDRTPGGEMPGTK